MNGLDILLLVVACVLVVVGMLKGLVRIVIGFAALIAAFFLAAFYHRPLAQNIALDWNPEVLRLVSYALIFVGVMIAGSLLAYVLRKLLKVAMLSWADRLAGAALGFIAAMFAAALIVLPLVAYSPQGNAMLSRSTLVPYVTVVADAANTVVPGSLADAYRSRVQELREIWREQSSRTPADEV